METALPSAAVLRASAKAAAQIQQEQEVLSDPAQIKRAIGQMAAEIGRREKRVRVDKQDMRLFADVKTAEFSPAVKRVEAAVKEMFAKK